MSTTMLLIAFGGLVVGALIVWGINYFKTKGKNPQAMISAAGAIVSEAKVLNDDIGKALLPAPLSTIIDRIIQAAQVGVTSAEQKCNSAQITKEQKNQNAYTAAMNLLQIGGYDPTPEVQKAVKDMIETGVFDLKRWGTVSSMSSTAPDPVSPNESVKQAITNVVTQAVLPVAQEAANTTINQALGQAVNAVQGALSPQVIMKSATDQVSAAPVQTAQPIVNQ